VAQLERKIGQQALEIDFLKGCLQRIDEQRNLQMEARCLRADPDPTGRDEGLTVKRMCKLAAISRAGLYRFRPASLASKPDLALRDAIQRVALAFPSYGWRREFRQGPGNAFPGLGKRRWRSIS